MHLPGQCRELTAGFWRRGTSGGQPGTGKGRSRASNRSSEKYFRS